jgi:hypothetical protein
VQQIEVLALDPPADADAEIAELARLIGGVLALHDAVEFLRPLRLNDKLTGAIVLIMHRADPPHARRITL